MKRVLLAIAFLTAAFPAAAARQEKWWEAYDRGVAAVRAGNHEVASAALQKAIAEQPNENPAAARSRSELFVYVPHFWLGIARFNLGDLDGALRELKTSEEQGVVQNTRYYSDLRDWLARVQTQKQRHADDAAGQGKRVAGAATKAAVAAQMSAVSAGAERSESYRAALRKLAESRAVASAAGTDMREYKRAADLASQARDLFTSATEEAKRQKVARAAATPPPRQPPPPAAETPAPTPQVVQQPAPEPVQAAIVTAPPPEKPAEPVISAAVADAGVVLQQYRRRLADATSAHHDNRFHDWIRSATREADGWQKSVRAGISDDDARGIEKLVADRERQLGLRVAELERVAQPVVRPENVQPLLQSAWRAFAAGDLEHADELLTKVLSTRQSAEALLLRGCTRYTRGVLTRNAGALMASADADFRSALKLNGALRLDQRAFSPKLVAHFEAVRKR